MKTRIILTAALILAGAARVRAQEANSSLSQGTRDTSIREQAQASQIRNIPEILSTSSAITEFNLLYALSNLPRQSPVAASVELGWLKPTNSREALGASAFVIVDDEDSRLGAKLRFRRWLSHQFTLNVGLGGTFTHHSRYRSNAFVGSVDLSWYDRLHLVLQCEKYDRMEVVSSWPEVTRTKRAFDVYAGLKFGREAGLIATSAAVAVAVIVLSQLDDFELSSH